MPRGYLDTTWLDFPPNVDQNYIRTLTTARGVSFTRVLQLIDERLRAFASTADPLIAALASFTPDASVDGTTPTAFELEEETEYGLPRPDLAEKRGHMLPFRRFAKALFFTEEYLFETATEADILQQVDNMLLTFSRGRMIHVLRRLFDDAQVYVDRKTTSTSPGFAGSGSGDNVFEGTYPDGTALAGGYTHYFRDETTDADVVAKAMLVVLERWNQGPFDLIGSQTAIDMLKAETADWVGAGSALIRPSQTDAEALVDASRYAGVFAEKIRVWHPRLELGTNPHIAIFKTFGNFDARNPLAIRFDPRFGRGVDIKYRSFFPLDNAFMRARWGVGVKNRTGAALARLAASGSYTAPTIS